MTSATSRPSGVVIRVCQIMVRLPRCTGVDSPITRVPTGAGATKLVLLSMVLYSLSDKKRVMRRFVEEVYPHV